jgi:hypothetical protein
LNRLLHSNEASEGSSFEVNGELQKSIRVGCSQFVWSEAGSFTDSVTGSVDYTLMICPSFNKVIFPTLSFRISVLIVL